MSARPFGTTPNEEIVAAFREKTKSFPIEFYPPGMVSRSDSRLWLPESDLLNLLDALEYVADSAAVAGIPSLSEWARDTRISILASLGLEETS